jgi:hypothetical protein
MADPVNPTQNQKLIDELSARIVELANTPEDHPGKAEIRAWAQQNVPGLAQRPVAQLPFTSVAAHMLASFGKINEAFVLAAASIRQHGLDQLCAAVVARVREAMLRGAFDALFAKRYDMAKTQLSFMVERLGDVVDLVDERAALDLLAEIEAITTRRAGQHPLEGRPTLVKLGVWGEAFVESAGRNVLATCLSAGNIPALGRFGPVIFHIHTRERDAGQVRSLPAIRELERHARIEIAIIPEKIFIPSHMWGLGFWNRNILAMVEYDSLMYARHIGADMVCLGADMVFSDGYLAAAKDKLAAGYDLFLLSTPRVTDEKITNALEPYRYGPALAVPADTLYRLSLEALHPVVSRQFMRQPPQRLPADPHQFFFRCTDGFAARSFQWHPLAFSARSVPEDVGFDGQTIDCRFPSDLLVGKDRDAACYLDRNPPRDGYLVSLDSARGITEFGAREVSPSGVAQSLEKWINRAEDFDHFEWMLHQRAHYPLPAGLPLDLPADSQDEDSAIEETIKLIEEMRPMIMQRIARYTPAR